MLLREIPIRLRDLPADLGDRFASGRTPLPPPGMRSSVGISSSRAHFLHIGERAADDILKAVQDAGGVYGRWLDFGCGAGRVARHIKSRVPVQHLAGVDVDAVAIGWAARHLSDEFIVIDPEPPAPFAAESFDVVYAVSVFTHFDARQEDVWLAELHRLLRPGGLFVATTHGPHLTYNRPDMTIPDHEALRDTGFVFRRGTGAFNEDSAFHARAYMERTWSRNFELVLFRESGLVDYHDLSVWRRR